MSLTVEILLGIFTGLFLLVSIIFIILYATQKTGGEKIVIVPVTPPPDEDVVGPVQSEIDFMKNNTLTYGEMKVPLSYNVDVNYFSNQPEFSPESFLTKNNQQRYDAYVAINNQTIGTSTYDCAVWSVVMIHHTTTDPEFWLSKVNVFLSYLTNAADYPTQEGSLISPRERIITSSPDVNTVWVYNENEATVTTTADNVDDDVGYHFRNLPTNGYKVNIPPWVCALGNEEFGAADNGNDCRINPAVYAGCEQDNASYTEVDQLFLTWSDYRPVTGENMWVLNAACQLYGKIANKSDEQPIKIEILANRLANTCGLLEAEALGIPYYSPQRNEIDNWNVWQYSVENMASTISALVNFSNTTFEGGLVTSLKQTNALQYAGRIAQRIITTHIKTDYTYESTTGPVTIEGKSVNQGGFYRPDTAYGESITSGLGSATQLGLTDGKEYATDCTTWVINVMGDKIDAQLGIGTCYELFQNIKKYTGYYEDGVFKGFGYSFNQTDNVHSSEWSIGGLFAMRQMQLFLYSGDAAIVADLQIDIDNFETKLAEQTKTKMNVNGSGLNYCNESNYKIPFGWLCQENPSLASTGWSVFWKRQWNPWRLDGNMMFCDFALQQI
jgi:hypothetical protein